MATQTVQGNNKGKGAALSPITLEGMTKVSQDLTFYAPETIDGLMNPIKGYLIARLQRPIDEKEPDKENFYYMVKLSAPCMGRTGDAKNREEAVVPAGEVMWVDERWQLLPLMRGLPIVEGNEVTQVTEFAFIPKKKIALKGGRTMWKGDVGMKDYKGPDAVATGMDLHLINSTKERGTLLLGSGDFPGGDVEGNYEENR